MVGGFITISRELLGWQWYDDVNAKSLFIHCLLKANFKDTKYRGIEVKRGQFLTGRDVLAREVGLTVSQVRTSLNNLTIASSIATKSTNRGMLITVINYSNYQDVGNSDRRKVASDLAGESPENRQEVAGGSPHNNNVNNDNNANNENGVSDSGYNFPSINDVVSYGKSLQCCTDEIAKMYHHDRDAVGWVIKGQLVSNWKSDMAGYSMRWARNDHNMGKSPAPKKLSDGVNNKYVPQPPITDEEAKQGAEELRKMLGMNNE